MDILYSEKTDKAIHVEVNAKGKDLSRVFGFNFHHVVFDENASVLVSKYVGPASRYIDSEKARHMIRTLYGREFPEHDIYINTTPFSTWNVEGGYVSLSVERFPDKVMSSFCHELNHFMYDTVFNTEKYEDTEVKETLTVLNETFGIKDYGWEVFRKQRNDASEHYRKMKDFMSTVEVVRKAFMQK